MEIFLVEIKIKNQSGCFSFVGKLYTIDLDLVEEVV